MIASRSLVHVIVTSAGENPPYDSWFASLPVARGTCAAPEQLHTAFVVEAPRPGLYQGVDGVWSRSSPLCIRTADCVPLLLADEAGSASALIHAGREGIGGGIVEAGVARLLEAGASRKSITAYLGPHIRACCYRFRRSANIVGQLKAQIPQGAAEIGGYLVIDLAREVVSRLHQQGVCTPARVDPRCTGCHPARLPSHRRQGLDRQRSLLTLAGGVGKEHTMNVDPELIEILACPETKEPVSLAGDELIKALNERISQGDVKNRGGDPVTDPVDGGLIREDRRFLYPIRDDIPIMLIEEAIELPPLGLQE